MAKRKVARRKVLKPTSKKPTKKPISKRPIGIVNYTPEKLAAALGKQREQRKQELLKAKAQKAIRKFKPSKKDAGKLVIVGTDGKRNPQTKGRKGYLVKVTKDGKVRFAKLSSKKNPYKPAKATHLEPEVTKRTLREVVAYHKERAIKSGKGEKILRCLDSFTLGGQYEFSDKVVNKMSRSLKKCIEKQASQRHFLLEANVLVELPDGRNKVYEVAMRLDEKDHVQVNANKLQGDIRKRFYAQLSIQLAYDDFVTSGSSNHTRRLPDNEGLEREDWTDKHGETWRGNEMNVCIVRTIEWRVYQSK